MPTACRNVNVTIFVDGISILIGCEPVLIKDDIDRGHEWLIANKSVLNV